MIRKLEVETPKNIWIDEFICLRSKMYASKCGNDSKRNLEVTCKPQSKNIKFEEYKKCLDGSDYQKNGVFLKFAQLILVKKIIFNENSNLHYLHLMRNDVL